MKNYLIFFVLLVLVSSCNRNPLKKNNWISFGFYITEQPLIYKFTDGNTLHIEYFTDSVVEYKYKIKKNKLFITRNLKTTEFEFSLIDNTLTLIDNTFLFKRDTIYLKNANEFLKRDNQLQKPILDEDEYYWKINIRQELITNIHFFKNNSSIFEFNDDEFPLLDYSFGSYELVTKEINREKLLFLRIAILELSFYDMFIIIEKDENNVKGLLLRNHNLTDTLHLEKITNYRSNLFLNGKWDYHSHNQSSYYAFERDLRYFHIPISIKFWRFCDDDNDFEFQNMNFIEFEYIYDKDFYFSKNIKVFGGSYDSYFSERLIVINGYPEYENDIVQIFLNNGKDLGVRFFFSKSDGGRSSVEVYYERDLKFEE